MPGNHFKLQNQSFYYWIASIFPQECYGDYNVIHDWALISGPHIAANRWTISFVSSWVQCLEHCQGTPKKCIDLTYNLVLICWKYSNIGMSIMQIILIWFNIIYLWWIPLVVGTIHASIHKDEPLFVLSSKTCLHSTQIEIFATIFHFCISK